MKIFSLKKQILQKKSSIFIESFDFVFIFANLNISQKKKNILKNFLQNINTKGEKDQKAQNKNHSIQTSLTFSSQTNEEKETYSKNLDKKNSNSFCSNLSKSVILNVKKNPSLIEREDDTFISEKLSFSRENFNLEKTYKKKPLLHLKNKSLIDLNLYSSLPFKGPCILIGTQFEENGEQTFIFLEKVLEKGYMGGFYKGKFLTKKVLKAFCTVTSRQKEIYSSFLNCLQISLKNLKIINSKPLQFALLLQKLKKQPLKTEKI